MGTANMTRTWRKWLLVPVGILVGAVFNAMLAEKGADTPALALVGGAIGLALCLLLTRLQARRGGSAR